MITNYTKDGLFIYPETEFEREYLATFKNVDIKARIKTNLSHSDVTGIQLTKIINNNE